MNVSAGGRIKLKTLEEAMDLIENMAASDIAILRDRAHLPTKKILLLRLLVFFSSCAIFLSFQQSSSFHLVAGLVEVNYRSGGSQYMVVVVVGIAVQWRRR